MASLKNDLCKEFLKNENSIRVIIPAALGLLGFKAVQNFGVAHGIINNFKKYNITMINSRMNSVMLEESTKYTEMRDAKNPEYYISVQRGFDTAEKAVFIKRAEKRKAEGKSNIIGIGIGKKKSKKGDK